MSNKRLWVINISVAVVASAAMILLAIRRVIDFPAAITFGIVLLACTLLMYFAQRKNNNFRPDERIKRVNRRAMAFSWSLTVVGVSVLFWLDHFKVLMLSAAQLYTTLLLFMPYSFIILAFILRRVGDLRE